MKTEIKYLNALRNLKDSSDEYGSENISEWSRRHKLNNRLSSELKKAGIIKKNGRGYCWDTIPPNIHMVRKLINNINKSYRERGKGAKSKPARRKKTDITNGDVIEGKIAYTPLKERISARVVIKLFGISIFELTKTK